MLFAWLASHCNSQALKATARSVGWRFSFFAPAKKVQLLEEMTFLYVSLAVHGANVALTDHATVQAVVDIFLTKMRSKILHAMATDDATFESRYSARVGGYFELLRSGGDAIGLAGDFLVNLHGHSRARLQLQPSVKMAASVAAAQSALANIITQLEVSTSSAF